MTTGLNKGTDVIRTLTPQCSPFVESSGSIERENTEGGLEEEEDGKRKVKDDRNVLTISYYQ